MASYKCCNAKFIHYVCVQCYGIYHKSCIPKFRNKLQFIEENKLICCEESNLKSDYDEAKENLEKTVSELMEDGEIKSSYIQKLKTENNAFLKEALKREDEMNEIIQNQEDTIKELKEYINKLTSSKQLKDEISASTTSTQTNIKHTKNSFTSMDIAQDHITPKEIQETGIKSMINEVEITYLKKLLSQDEILIHSLRDQATSLKEQILLLNTHTKISIPPTDEKSQSDTTINKYQQTVEDSKKSDSIITLQTDTNSANQKNCNPSKTSENANSQNSRKKITREEVSQAIDNAKLNIIANVKEPSADKNKNKKLQNKIVGANIAAQNLVAEHKHWLFVSKYKKTYQKETLKQYLQEKFPDNNFIIEPISNQGSFNSFKVGVDDSIKDAVLKPHVWPSGIEVSDYIFRRKTYGQYRNFRSRQSHWRPYNKSKYSQHSK